MNPLSSFTLLEVSFDDPFYQKAISSLRLDVWRKETLVDEKQFSEGLWFDELDFVARHWIVKCEDKIVAAARLTLHEHLSDFSDGCFWLKEGRNLDGPIANFCKLVVTKEMRGRGLGQELNTIRIQAAKEMDAKNIIVTASDRNAALLKTLGFEDTGIRATYSNRPALLFQGLQLEF